MASLYKQPYLDSSVFLAHIKGEQKICPGGLTRCEITKHIFQDAENKAYPLFTSAATLAEVRRLNKHVVPLDMAELKLAQQLFEHEWIQLIDVTREIGEKAQELGALYDLTPIDAIHVASAIVWKCDVLLIWDKPLSSKFTSPLEGVVIKEPDWRGQLVSPLLQPPDDNR